MTHSEYKHYRRSQIAELADWAPGFDMTGVSISAPDSTAGSPKEGDKIARNPANHEDRWLVSAEYFAANFETRAEVERLQVALDMVAEEREAWKAEVERLRAEVEYLKGIIENLEGASDAIRPITRTEGAEALGRGWWRSG